jgi:hypothetical protein
VTTELEPATEERETNNMDLSDLYEEWETLIETKFLQEIVDQQLSKIVVEMESTMEWKSNDTGYKMIMGD